MKVASRKVLATLLAVYMAFCVLSALPVKAADAVGDARYTKKVVSVLYDNSGSMDNKDHRSQYAQYAAQMLMALMDERDTLYIVPMNKPFGMKAEDYQIDLKSDRNSVIAKVKEQTYFKNPSGGTPGDSVGVAVDRLRGAGMKKTEDVVSSSDVNAEYWLVVLTDGQFSGGKAEELIRKYASGYSNLHTIYIGFGKDAADLRTGTGLNSIMPFTAYQSNSSDQIIGIMQQISCQLSGKCELDKSAIRVNGSKVTIDLDQYDFSISSISAIVQDSGATLQSASYSSANVRITQASAIVPDGLLQMKNGYSAVIKGTSSDSFFSGGQVELQYSAEIDKDKISVLIEPALSIYPYAEYCENGQWIEVSPQYINEKLSPGDLIRVGYRVNERKNGSEIDLKKSFGSVTETVMYAGQTCGIGSPFALVEGKNEVSVEVDVLNGAYKMYGSIFCNVEKDPSFFRIESNAVGPVNGDPEKYRIDYSVYVDNKLCSPNELKAKHFTWSATASDASGNPVKVSTGTEGTTLFTVLDSSGNASDSFLVKFTVQTDATIGAKDAKMRTCETKIEYEDVAVSSTAKSGVGGDELKGSVEYTVSIGGKTVSAEILSKYKWSIKAESPDGTNYPIKTSFSSGKLVADLDFSGGRKGTYTVTLSVEGRRGLIEDVQKLSAAASSMDLTLTKNDCTSITQYGLLKNGGEIVFELTSEGKRLDIASDMKIVLTFDGKDVSAHATVLDNYLIYVPKAEDLGSATVSPGTKTVSASISYVNKPAVSAKAETSIDVLKSLYTFETVSTDTKTIDRYDLENCRASVAFHLLLDGDPVSYNDLNTLYESGEIHIDDGGRFSWMFWLPYGKQIEVCDEAGVGVLCCRIVKDINCPLNWFACNWATFISNGDKTLTVSFADAALSDTVTVVKSPIYKIALHVFLMALDVLLFLWVLGFFFVKSFSSGAVVNFTMNMVNGGRPAGYDYEKINVGFRKKWLWHWKRLVPWHLFMNQPDQEVNGVRFVFSDGEEYFAFSDDNVVDASWDEIEEVSNYLSSVRDDMNKVKGADDLDIRSDTLRRSFTPNEEGQISENGMMRVSGEWYVVRRRRAQSMVITEAYKFVRK